MGGKSSAPPPPDYSGIAAASEASAQYSYALGKEQLAWARERYGMDQKLANRIVDSALGRMDDNDAAALADRRRYERIYQPLEDQAVAEAREFASPERQRFEMGRAMADVGQQFQAQRSAAEQQLESFGVDPSSTRFAALDRGTRVAEAAAKAGAANTARGNTETMGRAMRSEAINVGRGYPGQIAGTYGTALQSGQQGMNSQLATTASGANTMGTGQSWQGMGNQALGVWGNALTQGYNAQMQQYNANQASSSGMGSLLGGVLGLFMEDGGAVPTDATPGGKVPNEASPSLGKAIDDVPARLTAGEFVLPKDVVQWKGEEWAQKEIEKARKARAQAQAKPEYGPAEKAPPTFVSRPATALPVG